MTPTPNPPIPFLKRIKIRNFKSIAYCDVELGPLTILVGRNGSGKSNFLDAIRFVGECLRGSLSDAIDTRGGWSGLIHQPDDGTARLSMQLTLAVSAGLDAVYEFEISGDPRIYFYSIERERLTFHRIDGTAPSGFERTRESDEIDSPLIREYEELFNRTEGASRNETFHTREALTSIRALNMNHLDFGKMRSPRNRSKDHLIDESGSLLAEVSYRTQEEQPWLWDRLTAYLRAMVPIIQRVDVQAYGDNQILDLRFLESEEARNGKVPVRRTIRAVGASDGTLRALATLLAINPIPFDPLPLAAHYNRVRLVGVEEPESGLHPAAAGVLMDALREAAESRQIVVTTQSDDLLDRYNSETDRLLVVEMRDGATEIAQLDSASRNIIKKQLYSAGEMLRMDQLRPDWEDLQQQKSEAATESAGAVQ